MKSQSGFTLVELAIVLILIGILSAGVLQGYEMIESSRRTATIKQIEAYRGAFSVYYNTFQFLPGDNPAAQALLPKCSTAQNCFNGNGNRAIGIAQLNWANNVYNDTPVNTENTQVWSHLIAADLIEGVVPSTGAVGWKQSHPTASFNGGFRVINWDVSAAAPPPDPSTKSRIYAVTANTLTGSYMQGAGANPLSPIFAKAIDDKIDDGVGTKGSVLVASAAGGNDCWMNSSLPGQSGFYNTASRQKGCILAIGIDTGLPSSAFAYAAATPGSCGTAAGTVSATAPSSNLCAVGTASSVSDTGSWNWTCSGGQPPI